MTRATNARLAGFTFLFYIAVAFPDMVLSGRATNVPGTAAKLARIAQHAPELRVAVLLSLLSCFSAVVLAVTLYGVARDEDHELAVLAMVCRVGEGVLGAVGTVASVGLLWLGTSRAIAAAADLSAIDTLGAYLIKMGTWIPLIGATFFAMGSTIFSYLMLRGRMIPRWLAWLGVVSSALIVVGLPLELAGFLAGAVTQFMWLPIALFELTLGPWLLIKGVAPARVTR